MHPRKGVFLNWNTFLKIAKLYLERQKKYKNKKNDIKILLNELKKWKDLKEFLFHEKEKKEMAKSPLIFTYSK